MSILGSQETCASNGLKLKFKIANLMQFSQIIHLNVEWELISFSKCLGTHMLPVRYIFDSQPKYNQLICKILYTNKLVKMFISENDS